MNSTASRILEEAEKRFHRKGFSKTSLQGAAKPYPVGDGSHCDSCNNKHEILSAIFLRNSEKQLAGTKAPLSGPDSPIPGLKKYISFHVRHDPDYSKLILELRHREELTKAPGDRGMLNFVNLPVERRAGPGIV